MPELPEVEIAARNLRRWMRGKTIARVVVRTSRVIRGGTPGSITAALEGRVVKSVDRRGKWLRLVLDDGTRVFSHFGMSGRFVRRGIDDETERSERARFDLAKVPPKQASIRYVDPRMFGRLVVAGDDLEAWTSLGPDPLVDGIDVERLAALLVKKKRSIKETLMDQAVLAGVGNIQATEALWHARVDPRTRSSALTRAQVRAIAKGIDRSIADTLAHETGPEITYVEDAGAPNPFIVYGRGGDPCPRCKTALTRLVLGGRGTVYCGKCQR